MCFIPMPYGTHAYLFSISRCAFWNFVSVFELGMVGHTFLNLAVRFYPLSPQTLLNFAWKLLMSAWKLLHLA